MDLELMAISFLRFRKACPVALLERSPRGGHGEPDVLGITRARYLLEIEVKRSYSDFRANDKKRHISGHNSGSPFALDNPSPLWPKQFWYLVPPNLVKKVEPWVPDWAGLMRGPTGGEPQQVHVVKPSPSNHKSARLTTKEMMRLGHCMANQILCQLITIQTYRNKFTGGDYQWEWHYEI